MAVYPQDGDAINGAEEASPSLHEEICYSRLCSRDISHLLPDVTITQVRVTRKVRNPLYSTDNLQVSQREYSLLVPILGSFFACGGREVEFSVLPGADEDWVKLYLNGQVLVALLHQRMIINFHASSFIYNGRGVMVLGDTGAGKSSLTVSFSRRGAGFLTDDLTPVVFREGKPYIWPLGRKVKLRQNTLTDLGIGNESLTDAEAGSGKKYLRMSSSGVELHPLDMILKLEVGDISFPLFHEAEPAGRFAILRSEICSWEMLAGMPETEAAYMKQLLEIIKQVQFARVVRPVAIKIADLHDSVSEYLDKTTALK